MLIILLPIPTLADERECAKLFSNATKPRAWNQKISSLVDDLGRAASETSDRKSYYESEIAILLLANISSASGQCGAISSINKYSKPIDGSSAKYINDMTKLFYKQCYDTVKLSRKRLYDCVSIASDQRVNEVLVRTLEFVSDVQYELKVCDGL